jgi:hypothetical protein
MNVLISIPDDVAEVLAIELPDLPRAVLEAFALEGYRSKRFSDGQLRRILGFSSRIQVHQFLKDHNVPLNYSMNDLDQDRETSRHFENADVPGNSNAA